MLIQDAMTKNPTCCGENERASAAAQVFWEKDCGCAPVINDNEELVGFVTDRDLCMASHFRDTKLSELRLGDVARGPVLSCRPDQTLQEAENVMQREQIRRIPIVDANNHVVGLLSLNDIAVARNEQAPIPSEEVADTLGAICNHRSAAAAE